MQICTAWAPRQLESGWSYWPVGRVLSEGPPCSARKDFSHFSRVFGLLNLHACPHPVLADKNKEAWKNLESPFSLNSGSLASVA